MAVTDLTNTTWYVRSGWQATAGYGQFNVTLIRFDTEDGYNYEDDELSIGYTFASASDFKDGIQTAYANAVIVNTGLPDVVFSTNSFAIKITGGDDVTNADLISWLETYGVLLPTTDLTDTTWEIPAGWTATAGYGNFNITGSFGGDNYSEPVPISSSLFSIGYYYNRDEELEAYANRVAFGYAEGFDHYENFTISITGGSDVEIVELIAWLAENGTLQGGEEETTTSKIYIGSKAVKSMYVGSKAVQKVYYGNKLVYESGGSSEETVSITLVAENGGYSHYATPYIKFGTPPTSSEDYDYIIFANSDGFYTRNLSDYLGNNIKIDIASKAYIWNTTSGGVVDTKAGYKLNNGSLVNVGVEYSNATEVTLANGDTLTLVSTQLD